MRLYHFPLFKIKSSSRRCPERLKEPASRKRQETGRDACADYHVNHLVNLVVIIRQIYPEVDSRLGRLIWWSTATENNNC